MKKFTKDIAYEVLKQLIPDKDVRSLHEYYEKKEGKKDGTKKQSGQERWVGSQMTCKYNKLLTSGRVLTMEDVVVAMAISIGKMGVGPNEYEQLQDKLGKRCDFINAMAGDMASKG